MTTTPPTPVRTFKSVGLPTGLPNPEQLGAVVEKHAAAKNIPSVTFPSDAPLPAAAPEVKPKPVKKASPAPSVRSSVELPDYVWREMGKRIADEGGTKRFHILRALRDAGYSVKDVDLKEDGRRG